MEDILTTVVLILMSLFGGLSTLYIIIALPATIIWKLVYAAKHKIKFREV